MLEMMLVPMGGFREETVAWSLVRRICSKPIKAASSSDASTANRFRRGMK
jgi:hypothetical protein